MFARLSHAIGLRAAAELGRNGHGPRKNLFARISLLRRIFVVATLRDVTELRCGEELASPMARRAQARWLDALKIERELFAVCLPAHIAWGGPPRAIEVPLPSQA